MAQSWENSCTPARLQRLPKSCQPSTHSEICLYYYYPKMDVVYTEKNWDSSAWGWPLSHSMPSGKMKRFEPPNFLEINSSSECKPFFVILKSISWKMTTNVVKILGFLNLCCRMERSVYNFFFVHCYIDHHATMPTVDRSVSFLKGLIICNFLFEFNLLYFFNW